MSMGWSWNDYCKQGKTDKRDLITDITSAVFLLKKIGYRTHRVAQNSVGEREVLVISMPGEKRFGLAPVSGRSSGTAFQRVPSQEYLWVSLVAIENLGGGNLSPMLAGQKHLKMLFHLKSKWAVVCISSVSDCTAIQTCWPGCDVTRWQATCSWA
jgi:hypothetical protein